MTSFRLIAAFIARKPLTWAFHVLTLVLGVAVVACLLLLNQAMSDRFSRDLAGVDLVVGAKGSPTQLILSALFQIDLPTGNILLSQARMLQANHMVAASAPVSMGDNVHMVRIVGTEPSYFSLYNAHLAQGRIWTQPMEVVLGSDAARRLHMGIGATFVSQHGLTPGGDMHTAFPYRVVGILAPTGAVVDRLALTDIASVWRIHENPDEDERAAQAAGEFSAPAAGDPAHRQVTALLIKYRSAMGALMMPRLVRSIPDLQAAVPALEIARLSQLLGVGSDVLRALGTGLLALSVLGFFVALLGAVNQRQRELALLRALGAGRRVIVGLIVGEGLALGLIGGALGVLLARGAAVYAAHASSASGGPALNLPAPGVIEGAALLGALVLALAASVAPAIIASRIDPAQTLKAA